MLCREFVNFMCIVLQSSCNAHIIKAKGADLYGNYQCQYSDGFRPEGALFAELGMNLSTAFNIFVRQSLREGGIPFEIRTERPNKETVAAMLEAEHIAADPKAKKYRDLDELFADLEK